MHQDVGGQRRQDEARIAARHIGAKHGQQVLGDRPRLDPVDVQAPPTRPRAQGWGRTMNQSGASATRREDRGSAGAPRRRVLAAIVRVNC